VRREASGDANIVATMTTRSIRRLLTHNVSDFNRCSTWVNSSRWFQLLKGPWRRISTDYTKMYRLERNIL
jgi:hypothetical protein